MARSIGRSAFLSLAITIVSLLLVSPLGSAPTRVFEVATDSAVGNNSLGMPGSQDVIRDPFGKYVAASAQYVSATLAHDGSIIAVWNSAIPASSSTVFALRWTFASGWRSVSDPFSAAPDVVIVDVSDTEPMHPNVIERPDTFAVYV